MRRPSPVFGSGTRSFHPARREGLSTEAASVSDAQRPSRFGELATESPPLLVRHLRVPEVREHPDARRPARRNTHRVISPSAMPAIKASFIGIDDERFDGYISHRGWLSASPPAVPDVTLRESRGLFSFFFPRKRPAGSGRVVSRKSCACGERSG